MAILSPRPRDRAHSPSTSPRRESLRRDQCKHMGRFGVCRPSAQLQRIELRLQCPRNSRRRSGGLAFDDADE